ncbi:membrane protein insertase YidC [Jannaschia sp. Os4]|uniref:membrane protein insertase YidC n=1 Tax=Jannaschia sp. Os4 TaxID=2807617 RepID=UPI00193A1018|nr:membrane protein insertase YidC [Jannaschia sp. Os4]MBM2576730.1 membrane protein insertase YidC [Jannaschia sp. Os4]
MDEQNRNLILAMVLSGLVMLVWFVLFPPEQQAPTVAEVPTADGVPAPNAPGAAVPPGAAAPGAPATAATGDALLPGASRDAALSASARVEIETPRLTGSLSLTGGRIDDLALKDYRETLDADSPIVTLLTPAGAAGAYYALHGWVPGGGLGADAVPGPSTPWEVAAGDVLAPGAPVVLRWDNGAGLTFEREISVDDEFMFTVEQRVANATGAPVSLAPYGVVARHGRPDTVDFFILHEGVVAKTDGTLEEIDYDDVADLDAVAAEGGRVELLDVTESGWIGFTDKYWMTTLIPDRDVPFTAVAKYVDGADVYQTETRLPAMTIAAGATAASSQRLFAGAKEWEVIRDYEAGRTLNGFGDHFLYTFGLVDEGATAVDRFVDSIDWGWFYFLTKPIFMMLHGLEDVIGNMGVSIIVLTLIIKALLLPLAYKSYVSMARMKELQPEMEKLKEKAGDDRQKLQQGMMALYRDNKVNPAAGCLPILLQIPIFFSLYKVIFVTIDLRHAPFFGPFQDLSAPDPTSILNLFGLLPFGAPEPGTILALVFIGILPILLGVSMYLQQKLNPAPTDPTQAMIFAWLPWVFMFMLGGFASGLVVYWIANNTITFIQQYSIMRSQGMKPDLLGNIRGTTKPVAPVSKEKAANAPEAPKAEGEAPPPANRPGPSPKKRKPRSKR